MNILVINGSPKADKSNSIQLTNAFIGGICESCRDNLPNIERLNASQLNINPCLGCFSCWKNTPGVCCLHDDMKIVLDKLLWADITIYSFPLYYFGLPGKLKTLIDRQLPLSLPFMNSEIESGGHPSRYDNSNKRTVLISTCGFYTAKNNYDSVTSQFDKICGKDNYTTIFCGQGELFRVPELKERTDEYLEIVKKAGKEYISGSITVETKENLDQLLYPRDVFEKMADASWGISQTGEKEDESLIFTKQMAALYDPNSYKGKDIILDMDFTDINKYYRIILSKDSSKVVEQFDEKATTIIHTPFKVWKSIALGEIEGSAALMQHLYSVEGDFDLLLKWDDYFGQHQKQDKKKIKENSTSKTDMRYLLLSWITFWISAGINSHWGSMVTIFVCSLLPLLFYKNKKTIYDVVSTVVAVLFSLLLLNEVSINIIMPLSYLAFGLMWTISTTFKIPLTALYSMNDYGQEKAFDNPMFIKTNRILTLAWGLLYISSAIWTYFIMLSSLASYVGLINSILPLLMGIFTTWFQKWYPQRIAKGK